MAFDHHVAEPVDVGLQPGTERVGGFAAITLIEPPVEFCPKKVPCGPFNTST